MESINVKIAEDNEENVEMPNYIKEVQDSPEKFKGALIADAFLVKKGTKGGKPTVTLFGKMDDGTVVYLMTTGNLFHMVDGALKGLEQRP